MRRVTGAYAAPDGALIEDPALEAFGWDGQAVVPLTAASVVPMPSGASVCSLPGRAPFVGRSPSARLPATATAVGALLPQGYTRLFYPAYGGRGSGGPLPLFGYTAMGFMDGRPVVAAMRTDDPFKWDPRNYDLPRLRSDIQRARELFPGNRIVEGLARCAVDYSCFTAQNIFYVRWEGGIPVSPSCNARCLACISSQPPDAGYPSPQQRIGEPPTVDEIVEVAVRHLTSAPDAIVSFGQGCEGEPTLQAERIARAIARIRKQTTRGTINLNTNAGSAAGVRALVDAGLDSMRVTVISGVTATFERYHRPQGYGLDDVVASARTAVSRGVRVALNLLTAPGLTDRWEEAAGLFELIERAQPHSLQLRNLNVDPEVLFGAVGRPAPGSCMGIAVLVGALRERFPSVAIESYTKPVYRGGAMLG